MGVLSPSGSGGQGLLLDVVLLSSLLLWALPEAAHVHTDESTFVKSKPPRVFPDEEETVVTTETTIRLMCEGNRPLNWSIPAHTMDEVDLDFITIHSSRNLNPEYSYISHLEVRNSYYMDTGYHHCHYQGITDMNAVESVDKIYVYVNDSIELLVQNDAHVHLTHTEYQPAIIPCKPTSPDVNVTLTKHGKMVPCTDDFVTYDPKRGFVFNSVNMSDGGHYICNGRRKDAEKRVDFYLRVLPKTNEVAKPKIDEEGVRHVIIGMNVTINCSVQIELGITFDMDWKTPNGLSTGRVMKENLISSVQTHNSVEYRVACLELIILNVTHEDEGFYECTVQDHSHNKNSDKKFIRVLEIQKPIFEDSNMNGSYYYVDPPDGAEFKCNAKGVPIPNINWYKDGKIYDVPKDNSIIEFSDDRQTLKIMFVRKEDEGEYKCQAENEVGTIEGSRMLKLSDKSGVGVGLWIGFVLGLTLLCLTILYLIVKNRQEKKLRKELLCYGLHNFEEGAIESINPELGVDDQMELLPYDRKWEFPRGKLMLGKQLGSGAFGVVMKADACGIVEGEALTTVAVKTVKRDAECTHIKALASELKIMVHLGKHLNVVNLLGACTKNLRKRELLVIVEYCHFGNLQNYLLRHRQDFIDQIDPSTGKVDTHRGMENYVKAASSTHKAQEAGKAEPSCGIACQLRYFPYLLPLTNLRIKYSALSSSTNASAGGDVESVQVYSAAPLVKMDGAACSSSNGKIFNTAMSSMAHTGHEFGAFCGSNGEPEWRTNYQGDYGRPDVLPMCTSDLICWAFQVARGMDYLASQKVLHGDLAARNILLAEENIVKICDFGLAKSMYKCNNYEKKGDGPLPIKWMAIESIRDGIFSTQSDVWSFGIVLWELFSLAQTPYPGMSVNERFCHKLADGYRMEKPQYATDQIYSTMLDCWNSMPSERPTFVDLTDILGRMLDDAVERHYINLNTPYMQMNNQQESTNYLGMMSEPSYANAIRKTAPQREYVNAPTRCGSPAGDYLTMSSPVPSLAGSETAYLCMRSGSMGSCGTPSVLFSPRPVPTQIFTFDERSPQYTPTLPRQIRHVETKSAVDPELSLLFPDGGGYSKDVSPNS